MIAGAKPVYMKATRKEIVKEKIINSPLVPESMKKQNPEYVVVTNCTYDGVCYNAKEVEDIFQLYIKRIHFDEAWYGYAKFNPIYNDHFAMRGSPDTYKGNATIFATQSTHKLLNALSQSSYVHLRQGKDMIKYI